MTLYAETCKRAYSPKLRGDAACERYCATTVWCAKSRRQIIRRAQRRVAILRTPSAHAARRCTPNLLYEWNRQCDVRVERRQWPHDLHRAPGSTIESNWAAEHERSIDALRRDVDFLAIQIGPRNLYHYAALAQCADFCERSFYDMGCTPFLQGYNARNRVFRNIGAEIEGSTRRDEVVVVGAHYDTHKNSPGANDNASAIAALFQLARAFAGSRPVRTMRFIAFTNEESPFTRTRYMGSRVYAKECRRRGDELGCGEGEAGGDH